MATVHIYARTHVSGTDEAIHAMASLVAELKARIDAAGGQGVDFAVEYDAAPVASVAPAEPESEPDAEAPDAVSG